jgi:hypothetical protein
MNRSQKPEARGVAGVRLATSAQPPRAHFFLPLAVTFLHFRTGHPTVFRPSNKRHASGEPRLLRTPARSFGRNGVSKGESNPFTRIGQT